MMVRFAERGMLHERELVGRLRMELCVGGGGGRSRMKYIEEETNV